MTLPAGVTLGPGERKSVSQRGHFTRFPDGSIHFTACRFAVLAQTLERTGHRLPLSRKAPAPGEPDNFVHQLQLAGDNTPKTGSTIRQAQKALRVLFPDPADDPGILFGTMTEAEIHDALATGATVGIGVSCGRLPAYLRRWVGTKYTGGHYLGFDGVRVSSDELADVEVALTDPMFSPAKTIKPKWVPWSDVVVAMAKKDGEINVTLGYQPAVNPDPCAPIEQENAALKAENLQLSSDLVDAGQQIQRLNERIAAKDQHAQEVLDV